eukprot:637132-Amphidinium_carterae.1
MKPLLKRSYSEWPKWEATAEHHIIAANSGKPQLTIMSNSLGHCHAETPWRDYMLKGGWEGKQ